MAIITKRALVSKIAKELQIGVRSVLSKINAVIGAIEDKLMDGNKVVLERLGHFVLMSARGIKSGGALTQVI